MTNAFRPRTLVLFLGDILFFAFSLWLSLFLRAFEAPAQYVFFAHLEAFSILFVVWVLVFFIAGLYESRSIILARRALSTTLLVAQLINVILAALFFFFVPIFGIAPKTLLFIYLVVSFVLVLFWRAFLFPWLGLQKTEHAVVVGESKEIQELIEALAHAHFAPVRVAVLIAPQANLAAAVEAAVHTNHARYVIADLGDRRVLAAFPELYNLLWRGLRFFDATEVYEEVFGRIALSQVDDSWLARNAGRYAHTLYDPLKRIVDVAIALPAGILSLVLYPFIIVAIKIEDGGEAVISMPRVGKGGRSFDFYKFRSMSGNDKGEYDAGGATKLEVTKTGKFLRKTRLDELPQLWNIVRGDLSLVGPRPEVPSLVARYESEIPFYMARHLIKPGLSGSAQLYYHADPHGAADVEATRMKLSYDLFYLKHRSLSLDLAIITKTIRRLLVKSNA